MGPQHFAVGRKCTRPNVYDASTPKRCQSSGTPLRWWVPRSRNAMPDPITSALTVSVTRTSLASASAATRAPMWTARPATEPIPTLNFPRVKPGTNLKSESTHGVPDRAGTTDRPRWTVEGRKEPVARRVHFLSSEVPQGSPHLAMVTVKGIAPLPVAGTLGSLGRTHDVGEQHGGERAVRIDDTPAPSQELLDFTDNGAGVTEEGQEIRAGNFYKPGVGDEFGGVPNRFQIDQFSLRAFEEERWHLHRWQNRTEVDLCPPLEKLGRGVRGRR